MVRSARASGALLTVALVALVTGDIAKAQTFVQLPDMGSGIGPRLTRQIAQARLSGLSLFGRIGTKVSYVENGTAYQLASDPDWGRVLVGQWGQWVRGFDNSAGPGGRLTEVLGIDISARKFVYMADRQRGRVVRATLSTSGQNLVSPVSWAASAKPIDVAWDGQSNPMSTDYLFVLDDSLNILSYWNVTSGVPGSLVWSYGSTGGGVGQFSQPSAVCVGKSPSSNGGTAFTNAVYVVDRGNARLVRLDRGATPTWSGETSLPGWDPQDCAVDHFGNVYVADLGTHRIHKFTASLQLLDSYGTYGVGAGNMNTFASPRSVSIPCGTKVVSGQTVWYCEGRILTAERWGDSSGATEHYLGIASSLTGSPTVGDPWATVGFSSTDNAYVSADVWQDGVGIAKTLVTNSLWSAGQFTLYWDGTLSNGQIAPDGNYLFRIYLYSAYGCPNGFAYPWCSRNLYSEQFFHRYCQWSDGGGGGRQKPPASPVYSRIPILLRPIQPPPCGGGGQYSVAVHSGNQMGIPEVFAVRQLPSAGPSQPAGLAPLGNASGILPSLSISGTGIDVAAAGQSSLRASVAANGVSSLQVNLSQASEVDVDIMDLAGRQVYTLRAGMQAPGMYVFHWDGSLESGGRARPGVYLAVLRAQSRRVVSRLVLTATPMQ